MDALCLLEPLTLRIASVNESWSALFGHTAAIATGLRLHDIALQPDDIAAAVLTNGSLSAEAKGRSQFRHADGTAFSSNYAATRHVIGAASVITLLFEIDPPVDTPFDRTSLELVGDEMVSASGLPPHLRAAMRERIARCARQQSALLKLASADDADFDAFMRAIVKVDSDTIDCARVSYWSLGTSGGSIVCEALFDRQKGGFESGVELFANDFPAYFRALVTGALIPAHDAVTDPRTCEFADSYLRPLGIGAMLDIPVFLKGELVGVVCHEHIGGSRGWTMDEQQFALSIGQMLSMAIGTHHREEAARSLKQRDTALAEANAVLERALGPNDGKLTGKTLGRYRFEQMIGRGGVGEVYRAKFLDDGALVAVKVLRNSSADKPTHVQRLFREARLMSAIPSQHIAKIFEVGTFEGDTPYIAMELLEGHDLGWHLRRTPLLALEQVVELCEHTGRALAALREAGVVHRDIKPSNLFLTDALLRAWKLLDFGLSRSAVDPFETVAGTIAGTPHYMAPEQIVGEETDHRADLYALAAIAFRALTGRPPFLGDPETVLYAALTDPIPTVASLVRGVPVEIDLVFAIALAKDPDKRFSTVEAFCVAFRAAAEGRLDDEVRARGWRMVKRNPAAAG